MVFKEGQPLLVTDDGAFTISFYFEISGNIAYCGSNFAVPETFELFQNYPKLLNPQTTIFFGLPKAAEVAIPVFDLNGWLVT